MTFIGQHLNCYLVSYYLILATLLSYPGNVASLIRQLHNFYSCDSMTLIRQLYNCFLATLQLSLGDQKPVIWQCSNINLTTVQLNQATLHLLPSNFCRQYLNYFLGTLQFQSGILTAVIWQFYDLHQATLFYTGNLMTLLWQFYKFHQAMLQMFCGNFVT